ncbi:MAG TPA: tetratricopeptide repeat protein, partial [Gemmatimonadaceae bacterium]|nr:tetratricopeptide repeat protein [Gemmatimonadaceae bacterium]
NEYGSLPWIWPSEVVDKLRAHDVNTDLVTIARSVEGGYTPLQWKYLADDLAQRLDQDPKNSDWADCLRNGAESALSGDHNAAEVAYKTAARLKSDSAAPSFHLANLCAASGRLDEAKKHLQEAVAIDPSYRSPYSTAGLWYFGYGRYARARGAFERAQSLDPEDAYACLGLGIVAFQQKDWTVAETWFRQSLALRETVDAYRGIARVRTRARDYPAAIAAHEDSIRLVLRGQRSVTDHVALGEAGESRAFDSAHGEIHERLASLHAAMGNWPKAIAGYRMAVAMSGSPSASLGLARAYLRTRRVKDAFSALVQAATVAPKFSIKRGRVKWRRLRQHFRNWTDDRNRERPDSRRLALWGGMRPSDLRTQTPVNSIDTK